MATQRLVGSRARPASASTCCISRPAGDRVPADHKDVATGEVTPHHLTLAAPECYERLGTYAQMNPPVRDGRASRRHLARRRARRRRRARLRPRAAYARGKGQALSGLALRHDRRADAGADHARPRQCRAAVAGALRRYDQRRPGAAVRHRRQGPHRGRLRRRFHHRRSEAQRDHHQRMGRLARRLDALRRRRPSPAGRSARSCAADA